MRIDNLETVNGLVAQKESQNLELKETTGQLDRGFETLCAFLNGSGGTVLFGISDNGTILGQEVGDNTKRAIAECLRRFEPTPTIQVNYIPVNGNGKNVIALHAEDARLDRPFMYKGRPYMRIETATSQMPQSLYEQLLLERDGTRHRWEAFKNPDLKLSDMDKDEILKTVRMGVENGRLPESTGTHIPSILEKMDLMKDGILTHAAAILFANKEMLIDYPQCLMRLARFKGNGKSEFVDNQRYYGNIFYLFDAAMSFIFKHLNLSGRIENTVREESLSIPYKALREAVLNALAHRSYREAGGSVGIAIYNDRIEIENPGGLPRGWDVGKLTSEHNSVPQNPLIANVLYKRGYLESWGRGIKLIMDECENAGLPSPEYIVSDTDVRVIFRLVERLHPTSTRQVPDKYPTSILDVVKYVGNGPYSVKELMELLELKDRENFLKNYLYPAIKEELVEPLYPEQPKHPKQKYRITPKGQNVISKN